ncbi:MAG: glycosyltransferase family 4 protein [Methanobacterium sp. ERen5]|nr:MAG: glycosyltransferase family 4 protein [Methanobacterium sp. ERen5]
MGLPHESEIILFFGSLVEYKGPDILLNAFKLVKNVFPTAKLIFAGRGHMDNQLKETAKQLKISEDVIFTGFVDDDEKPLYYKAADVFCLPSTNLAESFGIVNLEAMAAGIPIVSSNLGGIPDIVKNGENGLLSEPHDVKMLAENLIKLLENDSLRSEIGKTGLKLVNNYTWDEVTTKTEKLYRELLE